MKNMTVKKVYSTIEELNQSPEFKAMWEGFNIRYEKNNSDIKFVKGFLAEDDRIYVVREIVSGKESGLKLLNQLSIHSCITNQAFKTGFISNFDNSINVDNEKGYDRCNQNRIAFAKQHKSLPEIIAFVTTSF